MVRDTTEGKTNFLSCRIGPMFRRWNAHLTKGRAKYPDVALGVPNWTLAEGAEELLRAKESAARHFEQWLNDETDEDHAAAIYFNVNLAEYVKEKMASRVRRSLEALERLEYDYSELHTQPVTRTSPWEGTLGFHSLRPQTAPPEQPRFEHDGPLTLSQKLDAGVPLDEAICCGDPDDGHC